MIAENEIHAQVPEIETAGIFFAEGRHQQAGGTARTLRNEAEGNRDRQRDILDHRPSGAENRFLGRFRNDFRQGQVQVIMRIFQIADLVAAILDIDGLIGHHLDVLPVEKTFVLLGEHIGNPGLTRIEIVPEFLHFIRGAAFGHFRLSFPFSGKGVIRTAGKNRPRLHVILHVVRGQFHVSIGDGNIPIIENFALAVGEYFHDGILCRRKSRGFERTLLLQGGGVDLEQGIHPVQGVPKRFDRIRNDDAVRMEFDRLGERRPGAALPPALRLCGGKNG